MSTFSERLRIALDVRGVSQHALARSVGKTQGEISNMVRGKRGARVQFSTIALFARALNVDPDWLGDGSGPAPSKEEARPDPLPKRAIAADICREAGIPERAIQHVLSQPPPDGSERITTLDWISMMQLAVHLRSTSGSTPPPDSPPAPARSHARPRADIVPPTRRSSPHKK